MATVRGFGVIHIPTPTPRDLRRLHLYNRPAGNHRIFLLPSLDLCCAQKSCRPTGVLGEQTSTGIMGPLHDSRPCSSIVPPYLHPPSPFQATPPSLPGAHRFPASGKWETQVISKLFLYLSPARSLIGYSSSSTHSPHPPTKQPKKILHKNGSLEEL